MELILIRDVENVGHRGDVVRVRDGYARNFLLPQDLAIAATRTNRAFVEEQRQRANKRKAQEKAAATAVVEKLSELKVTIAAKAGEKGKLFGSVTPEEICEAINQKGYQFTKKQIHLKESVKSIGSFPVTINVYPEVKATITLEVVEQS